MSDTKIRDTGVSPIITAPTQEPVMAVLQELISRGANVVRGPSRLGNSWVAACAMSALRFLRRFTDDELSYWNKTRTAAEDPPEAQREANRSAGARIPTGRGGVALAVPGVVSVASYLRVPFDCDDANVRSEQGRLTAIRP